MCVGSGRPQAGHREADGRCRGLVIDDYVSGDSTTRKTRLSYISSCLRPCMIMTTALDMTGESRVAQGECHYMDDVIAGDMAFLRKQKVTEYNASMFVISGRTGYLRGTQVSTRRLVLGDLGTFPGSTATLGSCLQSARYWRSSTVALEQFCGGSL